MTYLNRFVDVHGHYVFGVDDGAQSLSMSLEMIKSAYHQGVRDIVCTSHDSANLLLYKKNLVALQEHLKSNDIDVSLHPGMEIFCEEVYVGEIIKSLTVGELLPMANSKYVLLEFAPWTTCEEISGCVSRIRKKTKFEPIIAHFERYLWLQDEPQIFDVIKEMNILIQINAYSLVEESRESTKNFARKLLQEKVVTFIGSDAHRTDHRPVSLISGVKYIYENCDEDYANAICYRNAERLIL